MSNTSATEKKQYINARPASVGNIGQEILGAARHLNDTYDNPEAERIAKEKKASDKAAKEEIEDLKEVSRLKITPDNFALIINSFETKKFVVKHRGLFSFPFWPEILTYDEYMSLVRDALRSKRGQYDNSQDRENYNTVVKAYNKLRKLTMRNRYYLRYEDALKYFEPKQRAAFVEENGRKSTWRCEEKLTPEVSEFIASNTLGVQFGNSVPDLEREYCLINLSQGIKYMQRFFEFNWSRVAFSYGARGKAGSIAHYDDAVKVIQTNRHWDGATAHEMAHAIDYALGQVSKTLPDSIRREYGVKLRKHPLVGPYFNYYMDRKEIFARMFEQFVRMQDDSACPLWLQSTRDPMVMPDMTPEALNWLRQAIAPILKAGGVK